MIKRYKSNVLFSLCKLFLDEKPKFTELSFNYAQDLTVNTKLNITNCSYTAPYEYTEKFWTKNGKRINTVSTRKRRSMNPDDLPNLPSYRLEDFVIDKLSLEDQGTYKCGVKGIDGTEHFSKGIEIKLEGKQTNYSIYCNNSKCYHYHYQNIFDNNCALDRGDLAADPLGLRLITTTIYFISFLRL